MSSVADVCLAGRFSADWRHLHELEPHIIHGPQHSVAPFHALLLPLRASAQRAIAAQEAKAIATHGSTARGKAFDRHRQRGSAGTGILHIALMRGSANSNTARLATLLSLDDRHFAQELFTTELEAVAIAELERLTSGRTRLVTGTHTPLGHVGDTDAARQLSRFDIVLDASGHTVGNRLTVLAHRPSAVQTAVLGFPGSYGGHGLVDYLTTDRFVCPAEASAARCTSAGEVLSLLPTTYMVPPSHVNTLLGDSSASPRRMPRPVDGRSLLGSFTRVGRWHPSSFAIWSGILRRASSPRAVLVLLADDESVRRRVANEMAAQGLLASRVIYGRFVADKQVHPLRRAEAILTSTKP